MGERGPVGKRQAVSRNHSPGEEATGGSLELGQPLGPEPPEWLDGYALEWYEAIRTSGQAIYYTPGDWATAVILARCCMQLIRKPSAVMLASFLHGCTSLGITEGDRRRIHIELETARGGDPDKQHAVAQMNKYRAGLTLLPGDADGG
jgi:hypothetical protein